MFKLGKIITSVVFTMYVGATQAIDVQLDEFDLGVKESSAPILTFDGGQIVNLEETVSGFWTLGEDIAFSQAGTYELSLTDFVYPEAFRYLNASVFNASTDELVAEFVYEFGATGAVGPVFFDVDAEKYILSVIAVTDKYSANAGKFGLEINEVTQVPLPGAFYLMFSALTGLLVLRRKQSAKA